MSSRSLIVPLLVLTACENPIDYKDSGEYTPALVISDFFTPDSVWAFRISRSISIAEPALPSELFIENASVLIHGASGHSERLLHTENGVFRSTNGERPAAGEMYTLEVTSAGFRPIQSTSIAPKLKSDFLGIIVVDSVVFAQKPRLTYRLRFRVTDLPGKSYYRVSLYQVSPSCFDEETGFTSRDRNPEGQIYDYHSISFNSSESSFFPWASELDEPPNALYGTFDSQFNTAYFSDRLFENSEREFELFFEPSRTIFTGFIPTHYMMIISSFSEDRILYERSLILQDEYLDPSDYLFTTPIELYSNVEGGLGIFAGYSSDTYRIDSSGNEWKETDIGIGENPLPPCRN